MEMLDFQQDFPFKLTVKYESKSGSIYIFPIRYPIKAKKMDGNPNFHCGSLEDFREIFIFIFPGIRSKSWTSTNTANGDNQVSHIYGFILHIE